MENNNLLAEQIEAIVVETQHIATETLLKGKYEIGELIRQSEDVTLLVKSVARSKVMSENNLWLCLQFYDKYEELKQLPEFSQKNLSWNKIRKLMSGKEIETKIDCEHKHQVNICVCDDCGKKI